MVLTIDVGNTNTVLGGFEGEELFFVSRIKTDRDRMPDEYAIAFRSIFEINGYGKASFYLTPRCCPCCGTRFPSCWDAGC